jgi:hypothetical protein
MSWMSGASVDRAPSGAGITVAKVKLPRICGHRAICVRGIHDGQDKTAYPPESRRQMVDLVYADRSPEQLVQWF